MKQKAVQELENQASDVHGNPLQSSWILSRFKGSPKYACTNCGQECYSAKACNRHNLEECFSSKPATVLPQSSTNDLGDLDNRRGKKRSKADSDQAQPGPKRSKTDRAQDILEALDWDITLTPRGSTSHVDRTVTCPNCNTKLKSVRSAITHAADCKKKVGHTEVSQKQV